MTLAVAPWLKGPLRLHYPTMATLPQPPARPDRAGSQLQLRNARVQAHLTLVDAIANHYARRSSASSDDLDQVGRLGLIRAADLYDSRQAVPFSAYARRHVRGAILHYLRDTAPLVREPRRLQERRLLMRNQEQRLTQSLGRRPSRDELRASLGMSDSHWSELCLPLGGWRQSWLEERQQHLSSGDCEAADQDSLQGGRVMAELQGLPVHQRRLLCAVVLEGMSLRAVAKRQGTSLTTTHRQLQRALKELRTRLSDPSAAPGC